MEPPKQDMMKFNITSQSFLILPFAQVYLSNLTVTYEAFNAALGKASE